MSMQKCWKFAFLKNGYICLIFQWSNSLLFRNRNWKQCLQFWIGLGPSFEHTSFKSRRISPLKKPCWNSNVSENSAAKFSIARASKCFAKASKWSTLEPSAENFLFWLAWLFAFQFCRLPRLQLSKQPWLHDESEAKAQCSSILDAKAKLVIAVSACCKQSCILVCQKTELKMPKQKDGTKFAQRFLIENP